MKKRIIIAIIAIIVVAVGICGLLWFNSKYIVLEGKATSRDACHVTLSGEELPSIEQLQTLTALQTLDIQSVSITTEQYLQLQESLPDCEIYWLVPFQGSAISNRVSVLSVVSLTEEDLDQLAYMPNLQQVHAIGCRDYDILLTLKDRYPQLDVRYSVIVGSSEITNQTSQIVLDENAADELLAVLAYLPNLQRVDALGIQNYATLMQIQQLRPDLELHYSVPIGNETYPETTTTLLLQDADPESVSAVLPYLPMLTDVTFTGKTPDNDSIYEMMCQRPDVTFHWNFNLFGLEVSSTDTFLNLSGIVMDNTDQIESYLKYFQNLERVEMCHCGIGSDEMDAMAKRNPEIRFVWAIKIRDGFLRTDATAFIPYKIGYDIDKPLYDEDLTELKYCIDLICLDLGHMRMTDYSFLEYMPKMQYLLLGDTPGTDFSSLENLTELIYLEIFNTKFSQTELLLNFTKLEDLNLGFTRNHDFEVLKQLTWLKRLWVPATGLSAQQYQELVAALPDTQVEMYVLGSTGGNWRDNQNYRDMRDLLGMYYME